MRFEDTIEVSHAAYHERGTVMGIVRAVTEEIISEGYEVSRVTVEGDLRTYRFAYTFPFNLRFSRDRFRTYRVVVTLPLNQLLNALRIAEVVRCVLHDYGPAATEGLVQIKFV